MTFLALLTILGHIVFATAQHGSCSWNGNTRALACHTNTPNIFNSPPPIKLPETFDVNAIYASAKIISLKSFDRNWEHPTGVVRSDYRPFPELLYLEDVNVEGMNMHDGGISFPIRGLLQNANRKIKVLRFKQIRITSLSSEDFCGFNSLESLTIERCGTISIDPSAFRSLGSLTGGVVTVSIQENTLGELDFTVFEPLSRSLKTLNLQANKLSADQLVISNPDMKLRKLESLNLLNNKLNHMPVRILDALNATVLKTLELDFNPICEIHPDCGCCGMKPAAELINMTTGALTGQILCGNRGKISVRQMPKTVPFPEDCSTADPDELQVCDPVKSSVIEQALPTDKYVKVVPPLLATCVSGSVTLSDVQMDRIKSTSVQLLVDGTFRCKKLLHDVHEMLLNKAQYAPERFVGNQDGELNITCEDETFGFSDADPNGFQGSTLNFDSDVTRSCRATFYEVLDHLAALPQAPHTIEL